MTGIVAFKHLENKDQWTNHSFLLFLLTTLNIVTFLHSPIIFFRKLTIALSTLTSNSLAPRRAQYLAEHIDAFEDAEEDEHPSEHRGADHWPPEPRQLRHAPRQLQNVVTAGETS